MSCSDLQVGCQHRVLDARGSLDALHDFGAVSQLQDTGRALSMSVHEGHLIAGRTLDRCK